MINFIEGSIKDVKEQYITVMVNGLGLQVATPRADNFIGIKDASLYSYMHWNADNGPALYGFKTELERTVFLMVIDCPKVGPKLGLSILNQMSASEFLDVVSSQDEKRLSSVNGIGEKTAENIIIQLKRKVAKLIESGQITPSEDSGLSHFHTLSDALLSLGYSKQEITKTIQLLSKEKSTNNSFDQLMRRALSFLSK